MTSCCPTSHHLACMYIHITTRIEPDSKPAVEGDCWILSSLITIITKDSLLSTEHSHQGRFFPTPPSHANNRSHSMLSPQYDYNYHSVEPLLPTSFPSLPYTKSPRNLGTFIIQPSPPTTLPHLPRRNAHLITQAGGSSSVMASVKETPSSSSYTNHGKERN